MKIKNIIISICLSILLFFIVNSCSLFHTATAIVAFEESGNAANRRALVGYLTPSTFDVKIAAVYLSEDIDPNTSDNIGLTPMIYLNPACNGDVTSYSNEDLNYFNFAAEPDVVSEQMNAKAEAIPALTYRYVRIEFFKESNDGYKNVRWGTEDFTQEFLNGTGVITVKFDEAISVEDGQAIRVVLEYDISESIVVNDNSGMIVNADHSHDQYEDGDIIYDFIMPVFHPTVEIKK